MSGPIFLVPGSAEGPILRLDEPLSFWGGVDPTTGRIIEARHPQYGEVVSHRILAMPHGRGSSSSSSILAETLRRGCGPAGIVLQSRDAILVAGALVAGELYKVQCPIVVSSEIGQTGETWSLSSDGIVKMS